MMNVGLGLTLHVWLHGTGDDVLLWRHLGLFGREFAYLDEVVHQRVVFGHEQYLCAVGILTRADVVHPTVAHVCDGGTARMQF